MPLNQDLICNALGTIVDKVNKAMSRIPSVVCGQEPESIKALHVDRKQRNNLSYETLLFCIFCSSRFVFIVA